MEIKRIIEIFVETNRRFVVRQPESDEQIVCPDCGEAILAAEQIAIVFKISRRAVYKIVENGAAHFAETETGAVMICLSSFAAAVDGDTKQLSGTAAEEL